MKKRSVILLLICIGFLFNACENSNNTSGSTTQSVNDTPSWDLILTDRELNAEINLDASNDHDYSNSTPIGGNPRLTSSNHLFKIYESNYVYKIHLKVEVFPSISAARNAVRSDSTNFFSPTANISSSSSQSLQNYDHSSSPDEENPFLSERISVPNIGDQTLCYRWKNFPHTLISRVENIVVHVDVGKVYGNLQYVNNETLQLTLDIARQQVSKIENIID